MKLPENPFIGLAIAAWFTAPFAHAQLTWDANGTGTGQTNGGGSWQGSNLWYNGTSNQNWVAGSNAIFGGPSTAGGSISLASATSAGSVSFSTFTGTYTIQGTAQTLAQSGGITISATSGNVTFRGTAATTGLLTINGAGGVTMNGSGLLTMRENLVLGYTGATLVNSGTVMIFGNKGAGNYSLNGGMLTDYYQSLTTFSGGLGTGSNQIQIYGSSGFGGGNGTSTWRIGTAGSPLIWGAVGDGTASGFFNPSTLRFLAPGADNMGTTIYGQVSLDNVLDLNGGARTISVAQASGTNAILNSRAIISRNINGTGGGSLTKTGGGNLALSGTNDYSGGTTISNGMIRFDTRVSMPASGTVTIADGAILGVTVAGSATTWGSGTGVAGIAGLTSTANSGGGFGSQSGAVVNFVGNSSLLLNVTANTTESNSIGNGGATALSLTKIGSSSLTLSGSNSFAGRLWVHTGTLSFNSIANVGAGSSALGAPATVSNGTISIGSDGNTVTLAYTGTGHGSDRVINLAAASGTSAIDASGSGPLTLTSSLTAASGAKTLNLTGSNTAANTLGATSIPGLAEVLTITKNGAGTWWVNGFSSPKNAWTVNAGLLVLSGPVTTGDQQVTVSGGTLAGTGPVTMQSGKILTVQAAGSLSPGNLSVGTLAITGNLSVSAMAAGTGKLNFQIGAPASSDRISVTGSAQIGSGVLGFNDFVFTDMGGITPGTYVLVSTTAGINGTLDAANRNGMIGGINGTLQINGNNLEWSTDQDLDGIPDVYELANTSPPSATDFNPADDLDTDGSTNLQEYLAGTNPNNSDSDSDGFQDGVETNTGIWVGISNTGTNPLVFDTDGDGLRDGYETNTGIFVSASETGTNPNKADTDADAFSDNVETNTGVYVSRSNTGTDPNKSDTDNDGAGDWYEITASFTSPFNSGEKPNIPYPLPDPDSSTGNPSKPVKVYIMSGQSNMVGLGTVPGTGDGTLETMTLRQNKFPNLVTTSGAWTARQDVYYRGTISATADKPLGPGCGANSNQLGPELGFGHVMGWFHDEGVLLLKSSIGNRALGWDILPAGSARYDFGGYTYCGSGDAAERWAVGTSAPVWTSGGWYAGYEWDRFFRDESEWIRPHASEPTVVNVVDILDNWSTQHYGAAGKHFAGRDFEIAGFVWWQGERDAGDAGHSSRYKQNLIYLINSLRSYYSNRYPGKVVPNAPFVLATLGETSTTDGPSNSKTVFDAMMAVDSATGSDPQINVKTVYSNPLSEGGSGNSHYGNRAGTYMLVGDAMGRAMIDLQSASSGNTYAAWIAGFPSVPSNLSGFNQDADGDGIDNGAENFFGTNPGIGNAGMTAGTASGNTFTFTHPSNANPADGVTATYRWSKDLASFRTHGQTDGAGTTVSFNAVTNAGLTTVTATITGTPTTKLFVDVNVTQN